MFKRKSADNMALQSGSMKSLIKPTLIITLFTLLGQTVGFITQVVIAAAFGARADMDAFLAANTLPQYVVSVVLSAFGFVFLPVFVEYLSSREEEAWHVASGVITLCAVTMSAVALCGVFFAEPLLRLTTPGLSAESLNLAVTLARITWPIIMVTGIISIITSIYQAQGRFGWPAAVPVIGSLVNLGLVIALTAPLGVVGLAIAAVTSLVLQAVLLLPVMKGGWYRFKLNWRHPGVRQVFQLLLPLVLSGLLIRWTPIIERYLASNIAEGTIAHLGYALKMIVLLSGLISAGIATTIFPRMAIDAAGKNLAELRNTVSRGLSVQWVVIAPIITIGAVLALPFVTALFQRGAFSEEDAKAVALLLQIYSLSLFGGCGGNITGRAFYAMKLTRLVAITGAVEAIAYAVYTPFLAGYFGAAGIALGYVIYLDLSLLWQLPVIRYLTGRTGSILLMNSFIRTGFSALLGGLAAYGTVSLITNSWFQLFAGGMVGSIVYLGALAGLSVPEARVFYDIMVQWISPKRQKSSLPIA